MSCGRGVGALPTLGDALGKSQNGQPCDRARAADARSTSRRSPCNRVNGHGPYPGNTSAAPCRLGRQEREFGRRARGTPLAAELPLLRGEPAGGEERDLRAAKSEPRQSTHASLRPHPRPGRSRPPSRSAGCQRRATRPEPVSGPRWRTAACRTRTRPPTGSRRCAQPGNGSVREIVWQYCQTISTALVGRSHPVLLQRT